jgi:deoxyribodipyrimidine photo-lyase
MARTLVWFRGKDLRLADHLPLQAALSDGGDVFLLFVIDPYFLAPERARKIPHRIQFLVESLAALVGEIEVRGSRLLLVEGPCAEVIPRVVQQLGITRVVAQRWTEPFARARDRRIAYTLGRDRVPFDLFDGETLAPPESLRTHAGTPFSVYTPFARAFAQKITIGKPLPAPRKLPPPPHLRLKVAPLPKLVKLGIARNPRILDGGELEARKRLRRFSRVADRYATDRDRLDLDGSSRLSADLKFGTLSPRTVWHAVESAKFRAELVWREFAYAQLWDRPWLLERPFRDSFLGFPWRKSERDWRAWCDGSTGYPVVDAAARQLLAEGFVPNRARMIAASFLTKDLRIDFRRGEQHYLAQLTDGDWASNDLNWQWVAGCGCDAAPYFRVFNPVEQGARFDPDGTYVRRWVPELSRMPARYIHAPWTAPDPILRSAGVQLGVDYPRPCVDHKSARLAFLATARRLFARRARAAR